MKLCERKKLLNLMMILLMFQKLSFRIFDVILIFVLCLQELWPIPGTLDAVDIKNDILFYSFKYEYVIKEVDLEDVFDLKWILPILAIHKGDWDAVIALYEH